MSIDVFQHHNGIVDHQANGQDQRQQSECVDGEARQCHDGEGTNQADGNGNDGDDGSTNGSQENKNNQGHQNDGLQNGLKHALDGLVNEHRVVVGHIDGNITWQVLFQTRQHFANAF